MESRGFLVKGTAKPGFTGRRRGSRENSVYCRGGDTASESHGDDRLPVKRRLGIQEGEDAEAVCGPGFPGKKRIYERGMKGKRPAAGTFGGQKRQRSNRWRRLLSRAERRALGRGGPVEVPGPVASRGTNSCCGRRRKDAGGKRDGPDSSAGPRTRPRPPPLGGFRLLCCLHVWAACPLCARLEPRKRGASNTVLALGETVARGGQEE